MLCREDFAFLISSFEANPSRKFFESHFIISSPIGNRRRRSFSLNSVSSWENTQRLSKRFDRANKKGLLFTGTTKPKNRASRNKGKKLFLTGRITQQERESKTIRGENVILNVFCFKHSCQTNTSRSWVYRRMTLSLTNRARSKRMQIALEL